jgi:hypothetical protein
LFALRAAAGVNLPAQTIKTTTRSDTMATLTSTFPALTDAGATSGQFWPTTRKRQMVWLAMLTAITLIGQYVLLGLTGLGETRSVLPGWFTGFELVLWAARGLVEIMVVVYVGMTKADDQATSKTLWRFEVWLIAMIMLTVGPIWTSLTLGESIVSVIGRYGVYAWGFGLAGISAMMLLAVAYAFKAQPNDSDTVMVTVDDYKKMLAAVEKAEQAAYQASVDAGRAAQEREAALVKVDLARREVDEIRQAVPFFKLLPPTALVRVLEKFAANNYDALTLAEAFELAPSTVRGVLAEMR